MEKECQEEEFIVIQNRSTTEILQEKGLLSKSIKENKTNDDELIAWNKIVEEEQEKWDVITKLDEQDNTDKSELILYEEVLSSLKSDESLHDSISEEETSFCAKIVQLLFGPKPLKKSLKKERDLIFNITKLSVDNDSILHHRTLQTIFMKLTNSKRNCPRFGPHWEDIGFQGNDPATDLRGAGFLALLHLVFLLTHHLSLARKIFKLSVDSVQNFPFCLMSINMTKISLQVLKESKLSQICNTQKKVFAIINDFYLAVFLHLYQIWKNEHKTIMDSGHVISNVEVYAYKNPVTLLKSLPKFLKILQNDQMLIVPYNFTRLSIASSSSNRSLNPTTAQEYLTTLKPNNEESSPLEFEAIVQI